VEVVICSRKFGHRARFSLWISIPEDPEGSMLRSAVFCTAYTAKNLLHLRATHIELCPVEGPAWIDGFDTKQIETWWSSRRQGEVELDMNCLAFVWLRENRKSPGNRGTPEVIVRTSPWLYSLPCLE
jgi:hypothetical protein